MALFQRRRFVWNEPWFFQQRVRPAKAWIVIAVFLFVLFLILAITLYFSTPQGKAKNWIEIIGLSLGFAASVWWVLDGTNTRRQAVLVEDSIVVGGDMGKYSVPTTYKLSGIRDAAIVLPEASNLSEPFLAFLYDKERQVIGIEPKVRLHRLAQALHDLGISVGMANWSPNQENEFEKAYEWKRDSPHVTAKATIDKLPPETVSMMSPSGILIALVRQCWAIALWLCFTALVAYYAYQNWNNLGLVRLILVFAAPIGLMWLAGQYTDRIASASSSQGLVRMALAQILKRDGVQINPALGNVIPVEVFVREQFANTIQKIHEMGFIQPDVAKDRMLFEGKKERWMVPAESIVSLSIEEIQVGTPGQSAMGILQYYVVVKFIAESEIEFGFRYGEREFGEIDDIKRAEGALRVYEAFDSLLSSD